MKKVFDFGKIDYLGCGRRNNLVEIEVAFTDGVFTASGRIWNSRKSDIIISCQILEKIRVFLQSNETFKKIYRLWKLYHLNDMHAGTIRQEKALKEKFGEVDINQYEEQSDYLKTIGLYDDNGYKFGTKWIKYEIPKKDRQEIEKLLAM